MRLGIWTPLPHTIRVEPEMAVAIDELSHQGKGGTPIGRSRWHWR